MLIARCVNSYLNIPAIILQEKIIRQVIRETIFFLPSFFVVVMTGLKTAGIVLIYLFFLFFFTIVQNEGEVCW